MLWDSSQRGWRARPLECNVQKQSQRQPVAAERVTAEQALLGNHNSELIQIDGQLIGKDIGDSETNLLFASEKNVFAVALPKDLEGEEADAWKIGSLLRVTGICSVQLDAQRSAIAKEWPCRKAFGFSCVRHGILSFCEGLPGGRRLMRW